MSRVVSGKVPDATLPSRRADVDEERCALWPSRSRSYKSRRGIVRDRRANASPRTSAARDAPNTPTNWRLQRTNRNSVGWRGKTNANGNPCAHLDRVPRTRVDGLTWVDGWRRLVRLQFQTVQRTRIFVELCKASPIKSVHTRGAPKVSTSSLTNEPTYFKISEVFTLAVAMCFVKFRLVTSATKKEMTPQRKVTFQYSKNGSKW